MKRCTAFLITALLAGTCLGACGSPATPESAPSPTPAVLPSATPANPTALPSPTAQVEPTPTPAAPSFPGTAVSFDQLSVVLPAGLASGGSGTIVPQATGDAVAPWDVAPEHIQFKLEGYALQGKLFEPQIYVYPAQAYVELQERGSAAQSLEKLRALLAQSAMVDLKALPFVPFINVPQAMAAQVKVIPFQSGQGVRMLTLYAGGRAIINNHELIYHFQGLTEDGEYYVIAILPVTAPGLPADGQPGSEVPAGGVPVPDYNDFNIDWMGYYGSVRQMFQDLEPGAYTPDLDLLDALIESIAITTSN